MGNKILSETLLVYIRTRSETSYFRTGGALIETDFSLNSLANWEPNMFRSPA